MIKYLLALMLIASPAAAQGMVVFDKERIAPPDGVELTWERVVRCASENHSITILPLEGVVWMSGTILPLNIGVQVPSLGILIPPDTIVLSPMAQRTQWLIAHELLHYLLQTPEHPLDPFQFPCKLMDYQHRSGGIMAAPVRNVN